MKKALHTGVHARRAADAHIRSVQSTTEARHAGWVEKALKKLRGFAEKQSANFTIESARMHISDKLPAVDDLRVWGAVTVHAIRRGIIKPTDSYAPAASSHGAPKRLYRFGGGQ